MLRGTGRPVRKCAKTATIAASTMRLLTLAMTARSLTRRTTAGGWGPAACAAGDVPITEADVFLRVQRDPASYPFLSSRRRDPHDLPAVQEPDLFTAR